MVHICVTNLTHDRFRLWLVACMTSSHYLNQCWHIVKCTLWKKFSEIRIKNAFHSRKCVRKCRLRKGCRTFCVQTPWRPCDFNVMSYDRPMRVACISTNTSCQSHSRCLVNWSPTPQSCHDANFVVTVSSGRTPTAFDLHRPMPDFNSRNFSWSNRPN